MTEKNPLPSDLEKADRLFDSTVDLFDRENYDKALESAHSISDQIEKILDQLEKNYLHFLKIRKTSSFDQDKAELKKISAGPINEKAIAQLLNVILHFESHLRGLNQEYRRVRPAHLAVHAFKEWVVMNRKRIVIGGAAIGLIAAIVGIRGCVISRHHGLNGVYFGDAAMSRVEKKRRDAQIDFSWGDKSPFFGGRKDNFSIRWDGYIYVPEDDSYEFTTYSDDGVRLWINNQLVIEDWNTHKETPNRSPQMTLQRGYYPIRLEYFEFKKDASIRLFWKKKAQVRPFVVSTSCLFPTREDLDPKVPLRGEPYLPVR